MKRILIIDDDTLIRKILRSGLEDEGYEVFELDSGVGACELMEAEKIDLVTLDLFMDQQEGLETIRKIRQQFRDQPIIVISSNDVYFEIAKEMGADRTMEKPIDLRVLLPMVKELLS